MQLNNNEQKQLPTANNSLRKYENVTKTVSLTANELGPYAIDWTDIAIENYKKRNAISHFCYFGCTMYILGCSGDHTCVMYYALWESNEFVLWIEACAH